MLHARGQSTAVLQQQHVDRLHRHTIHTTSAGMAHANGPTARGNRYFYQLVVGTGATSGVELWRRRYNPKGPQHMCITVCPSSYTAAVVASLSLPLSLCVSLFKGTSHNSIAISLPALLFFRSYNEMFVQTAFIPYYLSTDRLRMCSMYQ